MRVRVVLVTFVAAALVAGLVGGVQWWRQTGRTAYEQALDTLPADTLRAAYTSWSDARARFEGASLGQLVDQAYDAGLTRTSALESTATQLDELYGVDLRDAEWEVYGQADEGAVAVVRMREGTSYDALRDQLSELGYGEPDRPDHAWAGTPELLAQIDPTLTPALQNVLLLEDRRLVLFSDDATYAERAAAAADGGDSLADRVADLAAAGEDPASAVLWAEDFACSALAMSAADPADQARGRTLVEQAGGVDPLDGLLMAADDAGDVRVAMRFAHDEQAKANLQARADLASGEAPGLGGTFPDRFSVTSAHVDGRLVLLVLRPAEGEDTLLSAISDGPVLFATC